MSHDDEPAPEVPEPPREASPGEASPEPSAPVRRPLPVWLRAAQLLLPFAFAGAAMGVHWWVNVPDKIVHSPSDQSAKDKDKAQAEKKKKEADRRARAAKRDESRTLEELEADRERYASSTFDEEPTRTAWARRHQIVINRAVVEARGHAFAGAPDVPNVVLASTTCRTIRCRFVLRSSSAQELELLTSALRQLRVAGEPVWHAFEVEPVPHEAPAAGAPARPQQAVQVTVEFVTDDTEASALEIPSDDAAPGEAAPDEAAPGEAAPAPDDAEPDDAEPDDEP